MCKTIILREILSKYFKHSIFNTKNNMLVANFNIYRKAEAKEHIKCILATYEGFIKISTRSKGLTYIVTFSIIEDELETLKCYCRIKGII